MMTDPRHTFENEQAFDAMLQRSVSDLPPDDIVTQTIPGKEALGRILTGYFLYTFTIHFIGLDFILPAIGQILVLLGFRALQHENRWFGFCYILEILHAVGLFAKLILNTTIIELPAILNNFTLFSLLINTFIITLSLFCFWRGLRTVQKKMSLHSKAFGVLALIAWYLLLSIISVLQIQGKYNFNTLYVFAMITLSYIFILWIVSRTSKSLDNVGYVLHPAPVQISNRTLTWILITILVIGSACGYLFFNSYSMTWSIKEDPLPASVETTKAHLIDLGFPEYILNDLSAEDIAACEGATQVQLNSATQNFYSGNLINDQDSMDMTNVAVLIPGDQPRLVLFHYFHWLSKPDFNGTDTICLNPAYENTPQNMLLTREVTGQLFYDNDGEHFSAPYHSIETRTKTDPIFTIIEPYDLVFANFSFPDQGENHRGYITYSLKALSSNQFFNSKATYVHQKHLFQYPVKTAEEEILSRSFAANSSSSFISIQPPFLFFELNENGITLLE